MKGKKIVSTLLALLLLASLPVSALAAEWDISKGDITVNAGSGGQTVTQGSQVNVSDNAPVIKGSSKENTVTINAEKDQTASVTLSGASIDVRDKRKAAVSTTGEGNVSIELNGESTLRSGYEHAGLEKNNGGSLTIADEDKNGKLTAWGEQQGAGIGGGSGKDGSNIFITGGGVNAIGGLAAAGIGTAAAAFSGAASAQCRNDLKWDETHEIVVVGAGGAGMAAAVKAAQTGAKDILVLEKLAFTGGNTLIAQGFINAADPVRQPRQGIKDSPENHMKQTLAAGDFRGDPERVKVLCDNAYGAITWLESLGMKFKDNVIQIFGALYPRSHIPALPKGQGYGTVLTKAAKELGVQVHTGLGVTEIIREEQFAGRVIGVKVQPAKGPARFIRATKAVVLAAGGFSGNRYLRELHDPRVKGLGTDNLPGSTGEVAMAAVRVGAYLVGMDFIQSTPGAPAGKKMKLLLNFNVNGSIYVDKRGNRIVNEGERRDVIRDAVLGTPERYGYTVCDNTNFMSYDAVNRKAIMEGIKINEAWTAPTIRELAEKMGVDPDGLEKTIKRYNEVFVKNGRDDDFHKQPVNLTKRIEDGPFWACYTGMTVHHTMGGINTNVKAQALDWEGKVIPGLYAAGEITGGIHGTNRVGGNAVLDCFVFGQIAGENAAKEVA